MLDVRETRQGSEAVGAAIQRRAVRRLSAIQEALILVVPPPPVAGIGNAGGFRMMVEDRAGRGSQALQEATAAMMARATQTPGLSQVFSLFETSTPQLYLDIDRTKAQMLGVNVPDVFARCRSISARPTSTTSTCSAAPSGSPRRPTSPIARTITATC